MSAISQEPEPGQSYHCYQGDVFTFHLRVPEGARGAAFLRTNIGHAAVIRDEIIAAVLQQQPPLNRDWYDIPMRLLEPGTYEIRVPLCETGHFEAKCLFLPTAAKQPLWPQGENVSLNVSPAGTCCANIIYNAFVRQFGPGKTGGLHLTDIQAETIRELDQAGYAVIPPSGTFRDLIRELDFIIYHLGCRYLQLLPIHPTPTTYARMGRFGSPYAALGFTAVDPAQAEFDPAATPLEQFQELLDAVHQRSARIILDLAINHTGWAARMHETHPEWLARDAEGRIENPGAWGIVWEDLTRLDYRHQDLWQTMAKIFLTWCRRGVDGFRCDAGYMVPLAAWRFIIATVRAQFPETVFFLEGLGGKLSVTRELLDTGGFDWVYSELFQNYDRPAVEHYLPSVQDIATRLGGAIHFAETHDNKRLAATSPEWARLRTALAVFCSHAGGFGFANGVEWLATAKINVHDSPPLNWGRSPNLVDWIRRLNFLLRMHPCFEKSAELHLLPAGPGNCLVLQRRHPGTGQTLLILINLDPDHPVEAAWPDLSDPGPLPPLYNLMTDEAVTLETRAGGFYHRLAPAEVLCLDADPAAPERLAHSLDQPAGPPESIRRQQAQAAALNVMRYVRGTLDMGTLDPADAAGELVDDPVGFCSRHLPADGAARVIHWQYPQDLRRVVMVPPHHFLLLRSPYAFRARLECNGYVQAVQDSLPTAAGDAFALFLPLPVPATEQTAQLVFWSHTPEGNRREQSTLLLLPPPNTATVGAVFEFGRKAFQAQPLTFLGTNGRGGMLRAHGRWAVLHSRYDALLAANPSADHPEDRLVVLARCRAWVVYQDYSRELSSECQQTFAVSPARFGEWRFAVPTGQGQYIRLDVRARMRPGENGVDLVFRRHPAGKAQAQMPDDEPVRLIVRPDLEYRNFHETIKAFTGPEQSWPAAVSPVPDGFVFQPPGGMAVSGRMAGAGYTAEPEWQYMVYRELEAQRGLDPHSDLFSPGYFSHHLTGGESACLTVAVDTAPSPPDDCARAESAPAVPGRGPGHRQDTVAMLTESLRQFVVKRGSGKTVIAGYPWFLDWGRDTLIAARGLIAAGDTADTLDILYAFAALEQDGTLPNMIRGTDSSNRNTSDAALWLFAACRDVYAQTADATFLDTLCGRRPLRRVLIDIAGALEHGTPNGIRMDPDSGLLFSPTHFTWMDTNHPPGTPREGYPIEIQALWQAALAFLADIDPDRSAHWRSRADWVRTSVERWFYLPEKGYLADCRHAPPGTPAAVAEADDALRPNQLLAVTLGALNTRSRCRQVVSACRELLVPGGLRSLADRPVKRPLVIAKDGRQLGDSRRPYRGRYLGDEDTARKPAYHNGTAWSWLLPVFCEALALAFPQTGQSAARAYLAHSIRMLQTGCVGHLSEIFDGDAPHTARGCDAQAWGVSELLRVWLKLTG